MRRLTTLITVAALLSGSGAANAGHAAGSFAVAGFRLYAAPAAIAQECRVDRKHVRFALLCPTVLPRSGDGVTPATAAKRELPGGLPRDAIGIEASSASGPWPNSEVTVPQVYVAADYGGAADPTDWSENNPNFFLDFSILQGQVSLAQLDLAGAFPHQLSLGARTIAGHRGHLYFMKERYADGSFARCTGDCVAFVGHLTFVWHQHGSTYAASLQRWSANPRDPSVLAILTAIVDHLVPG